MYKLAGHKEKSACRKHRVKGGRMREPHTSKREREKGRKRKKRGRVENRGKIHPLFYIRLTHEC